MNLKRLLIFVCFYISYTLIAQQTENFNGYWTYDMVVPSSQQDSTKHKLVKTLYGDMFIHLKSDGQYSSLILNRNENGNWEYDKKKIILTSSQGAIIEIKVLNITTKVLTIELANETFKLNKNNNLPLSVSKSNSEHIILDKKKKKKKRKKRSKS